MVILESSVLLSRLGMWKLGSWEYSSITSLLLLVNRNVSCRNSMHCSLQLWSQYEGRAGEFENHVPNKNQAAWHA